MARTTKTAVAPRRRARRSWESEVNAAVKDLLKAIPIDHLDERLTALEKWLTQLERQVRDAVARLGKSGAPPAARARRTTTNRSVKRAAPTRPRTAVRPTTRSRTAGTAGGRRRRATTTAAPPSGNA